MKNIFCIIEQNDFTMITDLLTLMPMFVTLLWAFILINTSKYNKAKNMLGYFMLATFFLFVTHYVYYNNLKSYYLLFDLLFIFCSLVIYPFYYLYIKVLTRSPEIILKDYLLFLPAFLQVLAVSLVYALMSKDLRDYYIDQYLFGDGKYHSAHILIKVQLILTYTLQLIYFIQIVLSSYKINKYVNAYNSNIENYYSNLEKKTIDWHRLILYSFLIISLLSIFYNFLGRSFFSQSAWFLAVPSVTYSILLFIFGQLGNLQNYNVSNFNIDKLENQKDGEEDIISNNEKLTKLFPSELTFLQKLNTEIKEILAKEELYCKPDLKITDLAEKLNTNRTYISNAINANCGCTFNAFINKFRIEKAKSLLSSTEYNQFSLEHIACLCGFTNLHTFIRVFKLTENTTPGKYRLDSQESDKNVS